MQVTVKDERTQQHKTWTYKIHHNPIPKKISSTKNKIKFSSITDFYTEEEQKADIQTLGI